MRLQTSVLAVLGLAAGCAEAEHHYELVDSLGVRFAIETHGADYDWIYPDEPPLPCPSRAAIWGGSWNRMIELCTACATDGGYSTAPLGDCRPTVCAVDDDCPQFGEWSFVCAGGVCQDDELAAEPTIAEGDATSLCAADVARAKPLITSEVPELAARLEALSCDDKLRTCELPLPEGCLQPIAF